MCWRGYIAPSCSIMLRHESLNVHKTNPLRKYCAHVWPWLGRVCTQSGGEHEAVDQTDVISMSFTRKVDQISLSLKKTTYDFTVDTRNSDVFSLPDSWLFRQQNFKGNMAMVAASRVCCWGAQCISEIGATDSCTQTLCSLGWGRQVSLRSISTAAVFGSWGSLSWARGLQMFYSDIDSCWAHEPVDLGEQSVPVW